VISAVVVVRTRRDGRDGDRCLDGHGRGRRGTASSTGSSRTC
jgi:hypothetical protein